ncbi:hypothetical protein [Haladaptatus sp. CMAA 1911]|uniref:hypothetical protein n=1 Tax=Haladaptatus sp. CMAA 1911 TaxID=3368987 RepID=UPI00375484D3
MSILDDKNVRTALIIGVALIITPTITIVAALCLAILFDNPPLTGSELLFFEIEVWLVLIGVVAVSLFIYYRIQ